VSIAGLFKRERPLSLKYNMPTLPAPSIKDDVDGTAEFNTPNSGSMDLMESDTEQNSLLKARNRSRSTFATEPDPDVQTAVIDWLRTKAELKAGYTEYMAARGKPQHNPDVVRHWEFAAGFFVQYKKATSSVRNVVCSISIYIYVKFCSHCHVAKLTGQSAELSYCCCARPGHYVCPECCYILILPSFLPSID